MSKRVLSVGNCSYDHANLANLLAKHFDVEVDAAEHGEFARQLLNEQQYHLVIVNRVFDSNQESGIEFIKQIHEITTQTPKMLISNYEVYQQEAMAAGAVQGFGKSNLGKPEVIELLKKYLS